MHGQTHHDIAKFIVAGINYKKTDAAIRGRFAVSAGSHESIISRALEVGIKEIFILSTCNRTEIYALTNDTSQLIDILCAHTSGDVDTFRSMAYIKTGLPAVEHLFNVAAGLDSQILGDYEIVGQIKQAVKFAKERGSIGAFIERLVNAVLQSSKTIKNQTELSGGTVSVSFSAVQFIKQNVKDLKNKKILLSGIGKIGRNTCRNLVDYLQTKNITLVNRTGEKAQELADELGLNFVPFEKLNQEVASADIILVSTNAPLPTILAKDIKGHGPKVIIDLSIPYNVEVSVKELPGVVLVNVDDLSKLKDKTLNKRLAEVPKANKIIAEHIGEFEEWYEMRKNVPVLRAVKTKLQEINGNPVFFSTSQQDCLGAPLIDHSEKIQKVINGMAVKMRTHNQKGCHYIQAINEFITPGINS